MANFQKKIEERQQQDFFGGIFALRRPAPELKEEFQVNNFVF
jgi:hypothetical protein